MNSIINVSEIISSPAALTVEQGSLLYTEMIEKLQQGDTVSVDFCDIESIITPFLNASVGKLYEKYTSDELKDRVKIINQPEGTNRKFNMVIRNAKQFYADKDEYSKIIENVLEK